jgi:Fe-S-cluster-containing dehydrogenase component
MEQIYTTCTFCDNLVYGNNGKLAKTPVCSEECRKKLLYKPDQKDNKAELFLITTKKDRERSKREDTQFVYKKPDGTTEPVRFLKFEK